MDGWDDDGSGWGRRRTNSECQRWRDLSPWHPLQTPHGITRLLWNDKKAQKVKRQTSASNLKIKVSVTLLFCNTGQA